MKLEMTVTLGSRDSKEFLERAISSGSVSILVKDNDTETVRTYTKRKYTKSKSVKRWKKIKGKRYWDSDADKKLRTLINHYKTEDMSQTKKFKKIATKMGRTSDSIRSRVFVKKWSV